jgi:hypothetical protein
MKTKYYRYTLDGSHAAAEAQAALGDAGSQGLIVRVDTGRDQTHVYVASEIAAAAMRAAAPQRVKFKEVTANDVTKVR